MEIRASYVLVGVFTLMAVVGALAFILWTAGRGGGVNLVQYDINFTGHVSGLSVANDVLFNGVKVGTVKAITISPTDPGRVKVRIEIAADTPVREDSMASLEARGITGVTVVQISGGTATSPLLKPHDGEDVAVIPAQLSRLEALFAGLPAVVSDGRELIQRIAGMADDENRRALAQTLQSLDMLTARLAARADAMDRIIGNLDVTTRRLANASAGLENATGDMRDYLRTDLRDSTRAVGDMARRMDGLVARAEPGVAKFSGEGLEDMRRLLAEARQLVATLDRLAHKVESDPRRFLFGNPVPEYDAR
ncbi:MlaD family protein [Nitratidesulfovibrio sp. 1201_IL3209]|uniref:MlaD family protein n=1 Tax=Nitratidesulfovibrio sp. 1201_IL3209 TaxID=3084053 RepID=UPI002FD9250B